MKKFLYGIITGVSLMAVISIYGSEGNLKQVFKYVNNIVINGKTQILDEANPPILYNGMAYMPVKMIGEAFNLPVYWEDKTNTMYRGDKLEKNIGYWGRDFQHMSSSHTPYGRTISYAYNDQSKSIEDNIGKKYSNYLVFEGYGGVISGEAYIKFPLEGKYQKFKTIVGLTKDGNNYPVEGYITTKVKIYVDNELTYADTVCKGDYPKEIELDITGAKELKICVDSESMVAVPRKIGFFNGEFIQGQAN